MNSSLRNDRKSALSILVILLLAPVYSMAQVNTNPATLNYTYGCYSMWPASTALSGTVVSNPGIVGILLSQDWSQIQTGSNTFVWTKVDQRVTEAQNAGFKVALKIVQSASSAPAWLTNNPNVQMISLMDMDTYHSTYGTYVTAPVFWDPIFATNRIQLIQHAGERYSTNGNVVAVMASFANYYTDDWEVPHQVDTNGTNQVTQWINAGYTTSKMLAVGQDLINATAAAFSNQVIKLPLGLTAAGLDGTATALASNIVDYAYQQSYGPRFFAQWNKLSTGTTNATNFVSYTPSVNSNDLLLKLLNDRSPQIGMQLLAAATGGSQNYRLNKGVSNADDVIFQNAINIGLSYHPQFLELWKADAENTNLFSIVEDTTYPPIVHAIAGGAYHSVAVKNNGTIWAWGANWFGQLGNSSTNDSMTAVQATGISNGIAVAAGDYYSLALNSNGGIYAWGDNSWGQLGDGTFVQRTSPVVVVGLTNNVNSTAAGKLHSIALKKDGSVWTWGNNSYGQLGNNSLNTSTTPINPIGLTTGVIDIAAGGYHSMALKSDGTVWTWGLNGSGELGNGTTTNSLVPIQVPGLSNVVQVAAGWYHSLALKNDGTVWAWGLNASGELGDGTYTDRWSPVVIRNFSNCIEIASAPTGIHSMTLKSDHTFWTWGDNSWGQLGIGSTVNTNTPTLTGLKPSGIGGAYGHTMCFTGNGIVYVSGLNNFGQLGTGDMINRSNLVINGVKLILP